MSNYDETYSVIYEVIMRKFWDLKFSEICRVSCVYPVNTLQAAMTELHAFSTLT